MPKECGKCGESKALREFSKDASRPDGVSPRCRDCRSDQNAEWRASNPDAARANHLRRLYGITPEQYDAILEAQGGVCAICGRPPGRTRLAVDHDHVTGLVRGLLCPVLCNHQLIGRHRDPGLFLRAYEYLSSPPAVPVIGEHGVPARKAKARRRRRP